MASKHKYANYYSVPAFAKKAGISTAAVYKAIETSRIDPVYIGRSKFAIIHPRYLKTEFKQ